MWCGDTVSVAKVAILTTARYPRNGKVTFTRTLGYFALVRQR